MCFTDEEKTALFKTLESLQKSLDILLEDREVDFKANEDWHRNILISLGNVTPAIEALKNQIVATKVSVKHEARSAVEAVQEVGESLEKNLEGKTKIIEKRVVENFDFLRPIKRLFRVYKEVKK